VYAATDESDVGNIRTGQMVTFKVDAYPKDTFRGRVSQVRMNATAVQNVVTYNTIIDFDNPGQKLFPGMTAYITIPVANAQNALQVPNGALRYKPDMTAEEIRAVYRKFGLAPGGNATQAATTEAGAGAASRQRRARAEAEQGGGSDATAQTRSPRVDVAVVWKLRLDKTLEPVRIRTGITDHTVTEVAQVLNGQLQEGEELVTGAMANASSSSRPPGSSPMGGPPRRR
jgi:HlyD family secretion protein